MSLLIIFKKNIMNRCYLKQILTTIKGTIRAKITPLLVVVENAQELDSAAKEEARLRDQPKRKADVLLACYCVLVFILGFNLGVGTFF